MLRSIANTYRGSFSGLSRETWLLSAVILLNRCGYMAVPFMSLYVTQSLNRSATDAGLIITLFGLGSILGAAAGGKLTDKIGFRPVQIFSSIIGGLFFLFYSYIEDFVILCIFSVVISFFSEAFRPANFTAIASYAKEGTTTRSYSLNRLATNIGWSFGISMGGLLASVNYNLLFYFDGFTSILVGILIIILLSPSKQNTQVTNDLFAEADKPLVKPWKDVIFVKLLLLTTLFATCFFMMFRVVPLFFKEIWHMKESLIGIVLGLNGLLIAVFEMVMINRIENKRPEIYFIIRGVGLVALAYLLLNFSGGLHIITAIVVLTCFTFGEMLSIPFINTLAIGRSDARNRGMYSAGYVLSWSVAQVIGPTTGFFIAENFGYHALWIGVAAIQVMCAYGFFALGRTQRRASIA